MISFVGAGPGDIELITVKGQRRLAQAQVVIYDRLVNPLLLFHCSPTCRFIYVGKTPYQPTMSQDKINQIIVEQAKKYKHVVRLKGGDPEIFGRLVEELEAVSEAHLPFEIVPGITSASASAAYNGMPLTERGISRSVTFTTGNFQDTATGTFPYLMEEHTICLYMGIEALPKFIDGLLSQGTDPQQAIAVIHWGTWGRQQKVVGTLATILQQLDDEKIANPAMIIIGDIVRHHDKYSWFDKLEHFGHSILFVSTEKPTMDQIVAYTSQGAEVWWHQVGENRDQRFDDISQRILNQRVFQTIIYLDSQSQRLFEKIYA